MFLTMLCYILSSLSLGYGHLMIMADQDHDGSHIKGLVINMIHSKYNDQFRAPRETTSLLTFYSLCRFLAFFTRYSRISAAIHYANRQSNKGQDIENVLHSPGVRNMERVNWQQWKRMENQVLQRIGNINKR